MEVTMAMAALPLFALPLARARDAIGVKRVRKKKKKKKREDGRLTGTQCRPQSFTKNTQFCEIHP
uniref:Secreted protein n=1 Tax=Oryza rufipogon TaxID=4529 RepID=A0A0E0R8W8_ORYRU